MCCPLPRQEFHDMNGRITRRKYFLKKMKFSFEIVNLFANRRIVYSDRLLR